MPGVFQYRVIRWHCQCGLPWQECDEHRRDPAVHMTTRSKRKCVIEEAVLLPANRAEPSVLHAKRRKHSRPQTRNAQFVQAASEHGVVLRSEAHLSHHACPTLANRFPHLKAGGVIDAG